eukprot:TRINITY_DN3373_c0_g1_i1.p1 TRINITY_DN3373_c0_g1~~TRINITY_DN3373_c0_g1_i1.p1  ORF type:complete len:1095 (-),score=366.28 TRINITY_DN3373_c0_g1_i1:104-2929(-)
MYDVCVALKQVNVMKELLKEIFDDVFPADDFMVLSQAVSEQLNRRLGKTHDSRAKVWLSESMEEMGELSIPLVTLVKRSWTDESFIEKINIVLEPYKDTLAKATKALKLSAKSPFDISMLDDVKAEFRYRDEDLDDIILNNENFNDSLHAIRKALAEGDEFELERAVRALEKDILSQIAAAEELANQITDPYLRAQLLAKVKAAKKQLADLVGQLAQEIPLAMATGDHSKVNALLNEMQDLYNMVSTDLAQNEVMKAGLSIDALLTEIPPAVDLGDALEARALNKDVAKEIVRQGVMARLLADNIDDDEYRKQRILGHIGDMEALQIDLEKATNDSLSSVPKARARLDEVIADLRTHNNDLMLATAMSTPEELLAIGQVIERALKDLNDIGSRGLSSPAEVAAMTDALLRMAKNAKKQQDLARVWASQITDDPDHKKLIESTASSLGKEAARLGSATKALLAGPKDGAAWKDNLENLLTNTGKTSKANKALVGLAFESPDEQLEILQGKIAYDARQLREAVKGKKLPQTAEAVANMKRDVNDLNFLASVMSGDIEDAAIRDSLAKVSANLESLLTNLAPESKKAITDYKANMPALSGTLEKIQDEVASVIKFASSGSPEDQMKKNADAMSKVAKRAQHDGEKGNSAKVLQKVKDEEKKIKKQEHLAKVVASRVEALLPDLAIKIVAETNKLGPLMQDYKLVLSSAAKTPDDKAEVKKMKKAGEKFRAQSALVGDLALQIKASKETAEEEAAEKARQEAEKERLAAIEAEKERIRRQKEMELKAKVPEGPKMTEIVEAVQEMTVVTDKYEVDSSAAGSLLELANRLALAFQQLASLAKTGTKKEMILKASEIAGIIKNIMKHIDEATDGCRDPHLNNELRDMGHVTQNYATQLKIICGVKGNLILEDDPDAGASLVTCAKGLCRGVGEVVKLSQIAKLKAKK